MIGPDSFGVFAIGGSYTASNGAAQLTNQLLGHHFQKPFRPIQTVAFIRSKYKNVNEKK